MRGDAFEAGDEHRRDRFIAMNVDREVDAGFIHSIADCQHFGAFLSAGAGPFAVEVHSRRIGAQMSAARAIGVGIGDDVEAAQLAKLARHRIGRIGQAIKRAFHPPFGHRFAGMLAGIKPHLLLALAQFKAIDRLAIKTMAQHPVRDAVCQGRSGDQIVMLLHRIGREIGEPGLIGAGSVAHGERAALLVLVIGTVGAAPELAVLAHCGAVIRPATRIGRGS